jgi:hypothetical protein
MHFLFTVSISLAPGFSPVLAPRRQSSRFNGLFVNAEAAEAANAAVRHAVTGLKPGANERRTGADDLDNTL